jgi:hypothetical protein
MISPADYCRKVETYLCKKNDGHLIRVVGPAFQQVSEWARQGIPLKVAFHGIDRYFERYHARGRRRWPVRIEFCENDVLDTFDEWRRAVGVTPAAAVVASADRGEAVERRPARPGLQKHLDRLVDRLTAVRATQAAGGPIGVALDRALDELASLAAGVKGAKGDRRTRLIARLADIDETLVGAVRRSLDANRLEDIEREAARELEPFRERMADGAFRDAVAKAANRLLALEAGLPRVRFE